MTALPDLVAAYLRRYANQSADDFWAFEEVGQRVTFGQDPEDAWDVTTALIAAAAEGDALGYVGAGPLEDLVKRFGPTLIDRIETTALQDPRFCDCLACVWLSEDDLPTTILSRVVRASGNRIQPLPPRQNDA